MSASDLLIADLSQNVFEHYGFTDKTGLRYFAQYSKELNGFNPGDVIVFQMKRFPHRYVVDFLLSTPFLWSNFRSRDWLRILSSNSPRPDPIQFNEESGAYADIHFLSRYFCINVLDVYVREESINKSDKKNVLVYFDKFVDLLQRNEMDIEDLDGDYFVSNDEIGDIKSKIISEGVFHEHHLDGKQLRAHMKKLQMEIGVRLE